MHIQSRRLAQGVVTNNNKQQHGFLMALHRVASLMHFVQSVTASMEPAENTQKDLRGVLSKRVLGYRCKMGK